MSDVEKHLSKNGADMKNFYKVAEGLHVNQLGLRLAQMPNLWNANKFRTEFPNTPHGDVSDILLRFSDTKQCDTTGRVMGDTSPVWHDAAHFLPEVKPLVLALMSGVGAYELGRLLISKLPPGGRILAHSDDQGEYVNQSNIHRYHIVINGAAGSLFRCGDEEVCMKTGEIWWFDARVEHEVINNSPEDRIHLLVDVYQWP